MNVPRTFYCPECRKPGKAYAFLKPVLEICCGSFEDVKTAYENGADRVELNSALYLGGFCI